MWLKFEKNYSGTFGIFAAGGRQDITNKDAAAFLLKEGSATKCCAPWEDGADKNKVRLSQSQGEFVRLTKKLADAKAELARLQAIVKELPAVASRIKSLKEQLKKAEQDLENAKAKSKKS